MVWRAKFPTIPPSRRPPNDTIVGQFGGATIDGGAGADSMIGGSGGNDVFVFNKTEANNDKVTDFTLGADISSETIHLTNNPCALTEGVDYFFT